MVKYKNYEASYCAFFTFFLLGFQIFSLDTYLSTTFILRPCLTARYASPVPNQKAGNITVMHTLICMFLNRTGKILNGNVSKHSPGVICNLPMRIFVMEPNHINLYANNVYHNKFKMFMFKNTCGCVLFTILRISIVPHPPLTTLTL